MFTSLLFCFVPRVCAEGFGVDYYSDESIASFTTIDGGCYTIEVNGRIKNRQGGYFSAEYDGTHYYGREAHKRRSIELTSGFRRAVLKVEDRAADHFVYLGVGDGKTVAARILPICKKWSSDEIVEGHMDFTIASVDASRCEPFLRGDTITVSDGGSTESGLLALLFRVSATICALVGTLFVSVLFIPLFLALKKAGKRFSQPVFDRSVPSHFVPIIETPRLEHAAYVAAANESWWLIVPGAWLIALLCSVGMALITAVISLFSLIDWVMTFSMAVPADLPAPYWFIAVLILLTFFVLALWFLREAVSRAVVRSKAVRKDPRRVPILQLTRGITWWNRHLPVFNDYAEAGGGAEVLGRLDASERKMRDWAAKMDRRLQVAPIGAFPTDSEPMPIPELKGLAELIPELKGTAVLLNIQQDNDDLGHPEREPSRLVVAIFEFIRRLLGIRSPLA